MKLLVSTKETQGKRANDFCWANDGEILNYGVECDRESVDGSCGCRRSLIGVDSHKATTTMMVANVNITNMELKLKLVQSLRDSGWITDKSTESDKAEIFTSVLTDLMLIKQIIRGWPYGSICERRGDRFTVRRLPTATTPTPEEVR